MTKLMNIEMVAEVHGATTNGIYHRIKRKQIPPPITIGGTRYWREVDWNAWLELQAKKAGACFADTVEESEPVRRRRGRPRKDQSNG